MRKKIINLTEYGILPDTDIDYTEKLNALFREDTEDVEYRFAAGTYRFHSFSCTRERFFMSDADGNPGHTVSLLLRNRRHITVNGEGSSFLFSGYLQPFSVDGCEDVILCRFSIDWEQPPVSEGTVVNRNTDYLDIHIDQQLFPCYAKNYSLYFELGDKEISELTFGGHTAYDGSTMQVEPGMGDTFGISNIEGITEDVFRLYITRTLSEGKPPLPGDVLVLRHNRHIHAGIFAQNTGNILCEDIRIHAAGGDAMLLQYCRDAVCRRVDLIPNREIGRRAACIRDYGIHIAGCTGTVTVDDCSFHGLQDDPIHLHNIGLCPQKFLDSHTLQIRYSNSAIGPDNHACWAKPGDKLRILNRNTLSPVTDLTVASVSPCNEESFTVTLEEEIPLQVQRIPIRSLAVENTDGSPAVRIRNCYFGSCRARGIFLNTGKPALIENCVFESSGSAILLAGDAEFWYATSPCTDVTVRNNFFTDACGLSMYQYCYAVISLCPDLKKPTEGFVFHRNIRIEDNIFLSSDTPLLFGYCTEGIRFTGNRIYHTDRLPEWDERDRLISLKRCRNAHFSGNILVGDFKIDLLETEGTTFTGDSELS